MEELIEQFHLPKYVKGKSFADASSMIMDKFRERKDPESKRTMTEMLDRLRQAQEFVKEQNKTPEERQQEQMQMQEQQMQQEQQDVNPQMEEQMMQEQPQQQIQQTQFAEGGLMDYIKKNNSTNQLAEGGFINSTIGQGFGEEATSAQQGSALAGGLGILTTGIDLGTQVFGKANVDMSGNGGEEKQNGAMSAVGGAAKGAMAGMALGPIGAAVGGVLGGAAGILGANKHNKAVLKASNNKTQRERNQALNTFADGGQMTNQYALGDWLKTAGKNVGTAAKTVGQGIGTAVSKTGQFLNENKGDILRYAPTAVNAFQLATLPKAEVESLNRLDNRYKPNYVDEAALQNTARENYNMTSQALAGASGGSTSALRSNILGAGLNRNKAISDAYLKADDINRGQDDKAQQFNLGVDRVNLQQSNSEKDINARNRAARDNEKSKFLTGIGTNLGEIGEDEFYKKIIGKMSKYDKDGNLIISEEDRIKYEKQKKEAAALKAKKGVIKSSIKNNAFKTATTIDPLKFDLLSKLKPYKR